MFAKRHYELVAHILRMQRGDDGEGNARDTVADRYATAFANAFEVRASAFDRARFFKACGARDMGR